MNLYEIMLEHHAPKDSEKGVFTYLVAKSDKAVYEWLISEQELKDGRQIFLSWSDNEQDEVNYPIYDKHFNVIGTETFKEKMIRLKGDLNDEDVELTDLYYGKTLVGWRLVKENITNEEIKVLKDCNICIKVK